MSNAKTLAGTVSTGGALSTGQVAANQVTGTLPVANGGTGLSALGSAAQVLAVDSGGTGLEYVDAASSEIVRVARTSNTQITSANNANLIDITSGTFTQTFAACSALGDGFFCYIRNSGTGNITLDPNSSETIDGVASVSLSSQDTVIVMCDGAALRTMWVGGGIKRYISGWSRDAYNAVITSSVATLPDLTTCTDRFGVMALNNSPAVPASLSTSDGWSITSGFAANTLRAIAPIVRDTPHGWWGNLSMQPPSYATVDGGTGSNISINSSVQLASTLHIAAFSSSTGSFVIAYNPQSDSVGSPVSFDAGSASAITLHFLTATTFALIYQPSSGNMEIRVGTVTGFSISLGSASSFSSTAVNNITALELGTGIYLAYINLSNGSVQAATVSGTSITIGTAVATGAPAANSATLLEKIDAGRALVAYPNAVASATTGSLRVLSISGTTITVGTAATTPGGNVLRQSNTSPNNSLITFDDGISFAYTAISSSVSTTSYWFGVTVSGTTVTIGAINTQTTTTFAGYVRSRENPYVYYSRSRAAKAVILDSSRVLFVNGTSKLQIVSISGTTLTLGTATTGSYNSPPFARDIQTGTGIYAFGTGNFSKISTSGTTITVDEVVSSAANVVFSPTVTDAAVKYGGTWYAWTGVPAATVGISETRYLVAAGTAQTVAFYKELY